MRKLEYNVQQFRSDSGFIYQSHQTLVWEDDSNDNHARHAMFIQNTVNGMSGRHYEDRFPKPGRFCRHTK
jgi:hypothetical protein